MVNIVRFKLMCYFLLVLSRGSRLKIEEGRLEVDIFIILSYLVVIMYFIHKLYMYDFMDPLILSLVFLTTENP